MEDSILESIKKVLGISEEAAVFDADILTFIHSAFFNLVQLGVIPGAGGIEITNESKWQDFLEDSVVYSGVKQYVAQKVRLAFDPPANAFTVDALEKQIKELEWRLNVQVDPGETP